MKQYIITAMLLVMTGSALAEGISQNLPVIMNAPVVLYDEANNLLENGDYEATVQIRDGLGNVLFTEEQDLTVKNSIAQIAVGQGYAAGSDGASPSGGLSHEVFLSQTDVDVYIWVRGVATEQHIGTLATVPYAFVSQYAYTVADDSIDSKNIRDGSITLNDLSQAVLDRMSQGSETGSEVAVSSTEDPVTTTVPLSNVTVEGSLGLNNASGSNLETVLQSLDNAIDAVREIHLNQGLGNVESSLNSTINSTQTTLQGGIDDVSTRIDGLDFSQISGTVTESQADPLLARDSEVTATINFNNSVTGGIHGLETDSAFVGTSDTQELTNKTFGNATLFKGNINFSDADCEGGICLVDGEDLSDVAGRVNLLEESNTSLDADITALENTVQSNGISITTLESGVLQNTSDISEHSSEISSLQTSVSQNTANIGTHSSQIASLQSQTGAIPAIASSVTALQTTVTSQGNNISSLDSSLTSLSSVVSGLDTDLTALSSTVSGLDTELTQTQNDLNSLSIEVAGVNSSVSSITQVFAFGHYNGSTCVGSNVQTGSGGNACNFIAGAGNINYAVIITPTSTTPCSIQAPIMTTPVKSANGFQAAGYCYGSSVPSPAATLRYDFIVYKW